jgi:hypothetical protein
MWIKPEDKLSSHVGEDNFFPHELPEKIAATLPIINPSWTNHQYLWLVEENARLSKAQVYKIGWSRTSKVGRYSLLQRDGILQWPP